MLPNPYESPPELTPILVPEDEQRVLHAIYAVGPDLAYRSIRFDVERRTWFRQAIFWASLLTLCVLLAFTMWQLPVRFAVSAVVMFILLHALQMAVPDVWARRMLRGRPASLLPLGDYHVRISPEKFSVKVAEAERHWPLAEVQDAFYLGDMLLVCPVAGVLIPIPRTADFGEDTFASFCRLFAVRLRGTNPHRGD